MCLVLKSKKTVKKIKKLNINKIYIYFNYLVLFFLKPNVGRELQIFDNFRSI